MVSVKNKGENFSGLRLTGLNIPPMMFARSTIADKSRRIQVREGLAGQVGAGRWGTPHFGITIFLLGLRLSKGNGLPGRSTAHLLQKVGFLASLAM
jgi:hypothetical protein